MLLMDFKEDLNDKKFKIFSLLFILLAPLATSKTRHYKFACKDRQGAKNILFKKTLNFCLKISV